MLHQITEKYSELAVLFSLAGKMGIFIDDSMHKTELGELYSSVPLYPSYSLYEDNKVNILVQKFNINRTISYTTRLIATLPLFEKTLRQV
ncbi:hypothetical protein [Ferroplasma sp.]|uniref:hypothetical protein n=1 Tax=Ferroplasma sp. TaxID=2591003 RepID=UPI002635CB38|nr:hypothetical protein [Ferroplasma sp.]